MDIKAIQGYLQKHEIDGWLMVDFHARNTVMMDMLGMSGMLTRRAFYFIPAEGEPTALVHNIEADKFKGLEGKFIKFSAYKVLEEELAKLLTGYNKIAMEYSPNGRLPYIGLVDAGTIELIRSFDCEIISSADMVANFLARLSTEQIAMHRMAAHNTVEIKDKAHQFIAAALKEEKKITEYDVQQFIADQFAQLKMLTDHDPNCSVNANAGNPHYEPTPDNSATINRGDLILIDLWGRHDDRNGVFADITWMAFAGTKAEIPKRYVDLFNIIKEARDTAVEFLRSKIDSQPVYGADVDDACRAVIEKAGYGEHFTSRTGHSITSDIHGTGPNIDNMETEDSRKLQQGHLFSIEPGVYFDDCGLRTEINVLIGHNGVEISTLPLQEEIVALFE